MPGEAFVHGSDRDEEHRGERDPEEIRERGTGPRTGTTGERARRLLPGVATILFAAQLNLLFSWSTVFLNDPGTGWHLRAGRLMIERGHWIYADPFSFTHGGEPWVTFEWLSEVVFALVEHVAGLGGLVWLVFCLFAMVPVLLFAWLVENGISFAIALPYAVAALIVFQGHVLARPHVFTYLGFTSLFLLVGPRMAGGPRLRHWLALPALFALWANLHGGFTAGLLWLGARIGGFSFDRASDRRSLLGWSGVFGASAAATLANPHGFRLHEKIWQTIVHLETLRYWEEFRPPDFYGPSLLAAVVLVVVFLLLIAMRTGALTDLRWEEFLPLLVFLFFSFKSQRHVFLLLLVAAVPVCRAVAGLLPRRAVPSSRWRRLSAGLEAARGDWWAIPLVALLFAAALRVSGLPQRLRIGDRHLSAEAAKFLSAHLSHVRRPLTTTTTGGPFLYYFFPQVRVSFDDRSDFYGDRVNAKFLRLFEMQPEWRATLGEGRFDAAILPPDMPLAQGLVLLPGWREVYRDRVVVILFRDTGTPG